MLAGKVPTFAGRVPLDRADVAEVGFAVGQPGGGQAKLGKSVRASADVVLAVAA